ncbi:multicopper oxidase-domain-containing protein [Hypoxylon crocopeplum]|nr:multicopper oxidase-domain-containing protein [Hypoxylon crocopeplum]
MSCTRGYFLIALSLFIIICEAIGDRSFRNIDFPDILNSSGKHNHSSDAPLLSKYQGNDSPSQTPWGKTFDPVGRAPRTGVIRRYNFTIQRVVRAPDGATKSMLLVNGQFPGPLIEANWGDTIEVMVHNAINDPKEGTSIHWHGLPQSETPWYDGVPSVQQCPIAPGETFVYTFQAEVYGTSWWHSHYSAQYIDGLLGPVVIYGPRFAEYDVDLGPIQLIDYTHTEYFSYLLSVYHIPPNFLPVDNNLINGRMPFNCSLISTDIPRTSDGISHSKFTFKTGKIHLLRLINAGGNGNQKLSIDNHKLTIIANDFRSDVLVKASDQATNTVWMRAELDVPCLNVTAYQPNAAAAVFYAEADTNILPNTSGTGWISNNCANDPLNQTVPLFRKTPTTPDITRNIDITVTTNGTGHLLFYIDNSTFYTDYGYRPPVSGSFLWPDSFPSAPGIQCCQHGECYVYSPRCIKLFSSVGKWDDGQQLGPGTPDRPTFIVIQWEVDNPGVWPFHCHLIVHVSAGLFMNIIERPDLITDERIPVIMDQTCQAWDIFAANNNVRQIDSGLKHRRDVSYLVPRE